MHKSSILIILYFLCLNSSIIAIEKVIFITGPESSGSKYIMSIICKAVYQDNSYVHWGSKGLLWRSDGQTLIAHHSQPTLRSPIFRTVHEIKKLLPRCPIYFVIPTRDHNIVAIAKRRRFNAQDQWGEGIEVEHEQISREILSEILLNEKAMIWSYETFIYLGDSYLKKLYEFLDIKTHYFPNTIRDENAKYIVN